MSTKVDFFNKLLFRRQFILGPKQLKLKGKWDIVPIKQSKYLHVQQDLPVVSVSNANISLCLLGVAIDPFHPEKNEKEIIEGFLSNTLTFEKLIQLTHSIVGRWIIVYQNDEDTLIFNDPCALRQVHYVNGYNEQWCASQPELLKQVYDDLDLIDEADLIEFLRSEDYLNGESAWLGKTTIYTDCFRLLPNHVLSLSTLQQKRFYPHQNIPRKNVDEIVVASSEILKGTMAGLAFRGENSLALTAGWDSRLLLAASKDVRSKFRYYVNDMGVLSPEHEDIWVPVELSEILGLKFIVKNIPARVPEWFINLNARNVTGARALPKNKMIYGKLREPESGLNVNGNGSEICRNFYKLTGEQTLKNISVELLGRKFGYKKLPPQIKLELEAWVAEIRSLNVDGFTLLDLLYWEHRMGIWGAQFPSEQDIAMDEFSPFNCRLLLENLNSSDAEQRMPPTFPIYKKLIEHLWPEVLKVPINPKAKFNLTKKIKGIVKAVLS
jgi:hypothetical protein